MYPAFCCFGGVRDATKKTPLKVSLCSLAMLLGKHESSCLWHAGGHCPARSFFITFCTFEKIKSCNCDNVSFSRGVWVYCAGVWTGSTCGFLAGDTHGELGCGLLCKELQPVHWGMHMGLCAHSHHRQLFKSRITKWLWKRRISRRSAETWQAECLRSLKSQSLKWAVGSTNRSGVPLLGEGPQWRGLLYRSPVSFSVHLIIVPKQAMHLVSQPVH